MTQLSQSAKKRIKEHFKEEKDGFRFCPYLVCSDDKGSHVYFEKGLWLEMCKEFLKKK